MTSAERSCPASSDAERPAYRPIEDYGAVGNLRSVALVSNDGSVDWCCFPNVSGGSVFGALLDAAKGGRFRIDVKDSDHHQEYLENTNILQTILLPKRGSLTVTDFMPLWGDIVGKGHSHSRPEIHRLLQCQDGDVEVSVEWSPRPDYARARAKISEREEAWLAEWGQHSLSVCGIPEGRLVDTPFGPSVRSTFTMRDGEERALVTQYDPDELVVPLDITKKLLDMTESTWRSWVQTPKDRKHPGWANEWTDLISRSELALKLLIHDDSGAIIAAPTTSLPEIPGGDYNWDYRYSWLRDSSMTAQALITLGHHQEAVEFLQFITETAEHYCKDALNLQIMYGVNGEKDLTEEELEHLEGYQCAKPVRIGNEASEQRQLEIYGEIMSTGYELLRHKVEMSEEVMTFLSRVADRAIAVWDLPDSGIWEIRGDRKHYTYSKVMLWVALDRAVHMSEQYGLKGDVERWRKVGDEIAATVMRDGYSEERGAFVEHFGASTLDAANLRIPLLEFLPFDDERIQRTIDRTIDELLVDDMLYRNNHGLRVGEGAFTMCTCWLVQTLALSGRLVEAKRILYRVAEHASLLGLFAEMFDPRTGHHLGNYPQGFSHIGLINAVLYVMYAEGADVPIMAPIGSKAHREILGGNHVKERTIRPVLDE